MGWQRGLPVLLGLAEGLYPFYWGLQGMYGGFCQFYWGLLGMRGGFTGIPGVCTNFTGIWGPHMSILQSQAAPSPAPCLSFPKAPACQRGSSKGQITPNPTSWGDAPQKIPLRHLPRSQPPASGAAALGRWHCPAPPPPPPAAGPGCPPAPAAPPGARKRGEKGAFEGRWGGEGKRGRTRSRCVSCSSRRKSRRAARTASGSAAASGSGDEPGLPEPSGPPPVRGQTGWHGDNRAQQPREDREPERDAPQWDAPVG